MGVSVHDKRDFADVIKLRPLRWGDDPGLSGEPGPDKREVRRSKAGEGRVMKEPENGVMPQKPRNVAA